MRSVSLAPGSGEPRNLGLGDFHLLPRGQDLHSTVVRAGGNPAARHSDLRGVACAFLSQPNISRLDGCRHPLPRCTSVQVIRPSRNLQRCNSAVSSGLFRRNPAGPRPQQRRSHHGRHRRPTPAAERRSRPVSSSVTVTIRSPMPSRVAAVYTTPAPSPPHPSTSRPLDRPPRPPAVARCSWPGGPPLPCCR